MTTGVQKSFCILISTFFVFISLSFGVHYGEYAPERYPKADVPGNDFRQIPRFPGSVRTRISDQRAVSCSYTIYYLSREDFPKIQEFYSSRLPKQGWQIQRKENYTDEAGKVIGGFTEFSKETLKLYVCVEAVPPERFQEKIKASQIWITLMESRPPWKLKMRMFFPPLMIKKLKLCLTKRRHRLLSLRSEGVLKT